MAVIVVKHSVNTGEKIYLPGEPISGLSKKEEERLVMDGVCRYPDDVEQRKKKQQPASNNKDGGSGPDTGLPE